MNRNLSIKQQEEQFTKDCKVLDLKYEYCGYEGEERYAIITALSEAELWNKYPDILSRYSPFVRLSTQHGEIIREFNRNEEKFKKRDKRNHDLYGYEEGISEFHQQGLTWRYEDAYYMALQQEYELEVEQIRQDNILKVQKTLYSMKPLQRDRLIKSGLKGMSAREIAREEGVHHSTVLKSLEAAKKSFRKIYESL